MHPDSNGHSENRSVFAVDQYYRKLLKLRSQPPPTSGVVEPYPVEGDADGEANFDHAFAGILVYCVEPGVFLLQQRDHLAPWNPNKISIFGGRLHDNEMPSAAAIRELFEETGIHVGITQLLPLLARREDRTRVAVFRVVYVVMLDRVPEQLRIGEGAGIIEVRTTKVEQLENLTMLSREDIIRFLDGWYPLRAA